MQHAHRPPDSVKLSHGTRFQERQEGAQFVPRLDSPCQKQKDTQFLLGVYGMGKVSYIKCKGETLTHRGSQPAVTRNRALV